MDPAEQLNRLKSIGNNHSFARRIKESQKAPLRASMIDILQINVGRVCNLTCRHCHVTAGPGRTETMSWDVLSRCLEIVKENDIGTIDITGGSPEMNPHLKDFITEAGKLDKRLLVRSNLAIIHDETYREFLDIYTENRIEVITSLPDYFKNKTDRQRGSGVFNTIIEVMQLLNNRGYGAEGSGLVLDIVHNPAGAYLPGPQNALEEEYRRRLKDNHGVIFNSLFTITNIPIGRYLEFLIETDNYDDYINELCNAYNPAAVDNVMCKTTLSVGWDGTLYDCDFNQMLELPVNHGAPDTIFDFDMDKLKNREVVIDNHCYGCVAGSGSSCQGATTEMGE